MGVNDQPQTSNCVGNAGAPTPEPPRRNVFATGIAVLSVWRGRVSVHPQSSIDAPADDMIEYEYGQGSDFWRWFGDQASMDTLADKDVLDAARN